ncbi:MarR family transcriptional regulator [Altererythrobacter luteolus]|uniref:MarR family transcriptional regulator n=1 Tax=Pontixanthobacter luteolus TaxID=295089 RepID=A0A6I4UZB8_9SPHN|nr:MarR family winged helix-turn-helix transcriptional regulator [Pontixanthobacter luteolus]MXP47257.1 MarR family transcriptional regulator [Pontixanthobacter luteolus]
MSDNQFRLNEFLPYQLSVASNAVSNRIARAYNDAFGLKVTEWRVMAMLGDAGALTQRELTAKTLMDKVAVNRACKVLEERKLAVRVPNKKDGRSHHLELTDSGRDMHAKIVPMAREIEAGLLASIAQDEQELFRSLLDRIRQKAS